MVNRISIEREFAVWKGKQPLSKNGTDAFRSLIDSEKSRIEGLTCTDQEVAQNSIEIKFSLIRKESASSCLTSARNEIERLASENGYKIHWKNQPKHTPAGNNEYFTTLAFPELIDLFVHGNSIHIHNEVEQSRAIHLYRQLNALAPWFLINSRERGEIDRIRMVASFRDSMRELFLPQSFSNTEEYKRYMVESSIDTQLRLIENGNINRARQLFSRMFPDGSAVSLSPDKVFHPARFRPDLVLPNGNISVEFRALDGIKSRGREIGIIETAFIVFDYAMNEPEITPIPVIRNFYEELNTKSKAYKFADEFINESMRKHSGEYLEAVNARS